MNLKVKLALLLLLVGLIACSKNSNSSTDPVDKDLNYPITISVFTQAARQQPNVDNKAYKYLEEKLGVTFKWDILVGEIAQKRGVMIAGGDYPDLIEINETQFIEAGALIPLEDLIEKYAPNVKKHYGQYLEYLKSDDGHIYYLTNWGVYTGKNHNPDYWGTALWVQKEVLKDAGYPKVVTMDEYFDLLANYAKKYPEINGQATIPFSILTYDWRAFCLWNPPNFLAGYPNDGNGIVDPDTLTYKTFFTMDIAKRWYKKLNEMNQLGLVDRSGFTDNYDQYLAKIASGRLLGMHDQRWQFNNAQESLRDQNMYNRTYAPLPIVYDKNIRPHYRDFPEPNLGRGVGISINAKDPARIMRFINDLMSEEVQRTIEWGIEDEEWQWDSEGKPFKTEEQRTTWDNAAWQEQNRALLVRDVFPTWEGSWTDGLPTDLKFYYPEREATLFEEDKELWAAYGVASEAEFVDPDPPPNSIWYPTWNMPNPPDGSDAQVAHQRCEQTMRKYLPQLILADPANFDALWAEYVEQIEVKNQIGLYEAYMQEELDKRIAARSAR